MAKQHKDWDKIGITWSGGLDHPDAGNQNQSIPGSIEDTPLISLGTWGGNLTNGGYVPCWADENGIISQERVDACVIEDMYFEDFDVDGSGDLDVGGDLFGWHTTWGRIDITNYLANAQDLCPGWPITSNWECMQNSVDAGETTYLAPKSTYDYTWNDIYFLIEIADGIGTGNRRAREARLQQLDKDKKKRLIHLICRVKGEKVYDEKKEVGDIQIKLEDAELVIEKVLGKMRVENTNVL